MADIQWSEVVGEKTIDEGGFVGDLLTIARAHVDDAVINNRLTQAQAGEVYVAMIPSAFQQAIEFTMKEQLVEAQIADTEASIALKIDQLALERDKAEAELEQHWGYDVTRDAEDALVLGGLNGTGKIDKEKLLLDTQEQSEQYNVDELLPLEKEKATEQIDLLQSQDLDVIAKTAIAENESIANIALVEEKTESEVLNNKADGVLENQILKIQEDIKIAKEQVELAKTQAATEKANSIANIDKVLGYDVNIDDDGNIIVGDSTGDGKLDYENELVQEKIDSEKISQESLISKTRDEFGRVIDESGNNQPAADEATKHYQMVAKAVEDVSNAGKQGTLLDGQKSESDRQVALATAKLLRDYGVDEAGDHLNPTTSTTGTSLTTGDPKSKWEADMLKASAEIAIGLKTELGFEADSYYKQAKISQEVLFALANAGVITEASSNMGDDSDLEDPYEYFAVKLKNSLNSMNTFATTTTTTG